MITIVLTNRNRDLRIVENCLNSLKNQTNQEFKLVIVDYGSEENYILALEELVSQYPRLKFISCCVSKQLWNKSRAVNIVLQQCTTPYFFVGDIDMLFRQDFIEKLIELKKQDEAIYFQVGVLSQLESKLIKPFGDYLIKHKTNEEATGMTLYPTQLLKEINGYDEFYHGWGAEDSDVHIRLRNLGYKVCFFEENIFLLHQWHPKVYRSNQSKEPFHSDLERINHQYIKFVDQEKQYLVNTVFGWGELPKPIDFNGAKNIILSFTNQLSEIDALFYGLFDHYIGHYVTIEVKVHPEYKSIKNMVKQFLGKKYLKFYDLQTTNNLLLGYIIARFRDKYYEYEWNKKKNIILLKIDL
jgi:glycosyltransferase involved in cell wall biosynthesis